MDSRTLDAARNGNRQAREQLLRGLQDSWYRLCRSLLNSDEQAREATQETAVRFLRQLPKFRGDSALQTWSMGIAINVAREMRRKIRPEPVDQISRSPVRPDELAERFEEQERLHAVMEDLPERQREALILRYFEGLSVEESALAMQCTAGTVKATVFQAIRAMRRKMWTRS